MAEVAPIGGFGKQYQVNVDPNRLRAYGVPDDRILLTGFPLPHGLVGGPELPILRRNLASRLVRLDAAYAETGTVQTAVIDSGLQAPLFPQGSAAGGHD